MAGEKREANHSSEVLRKVSRNQHDACSKIIAFEAMVIDFFSLKKRRTFNAGRIFIDRAGIMLTEQG